MAVAAFPDVFPVFLLVETFADDFFFVVTVVFCTDFFCLD